MQDERLVVGDYASRSREGPENPCVVGCAHLYLGSLFVLGEGMGSSGSGRVESRLAVSAVLTHFRSGTAQDPRQRLREALEHASAVLHHRSQTGPMFANSWARCVVVLVRRGRLIAARVGRIGLVLLNARGARSPFLDDSSQPEALLGLGPEVEVDVLDEEIPLAKGDRFLLANASLFNATTEDELLRLATSLVPAVAARRLVELVERIEGAGHVSVQIVQAGATIGLDDSPPERAPAPERARPTERTTGPSAADAAVRASSPADRLRERQTPIEVDPAVRRSAPLTSPGSRLLPRALDAETWPLSLGSDRARGRPPIPPTDLVDVELDRPETRTSWRWLGGVGLVAGLAVLFSLAFPRPERPDQADEEPSTPFLTPLTSTGWLPSAIPSSALAQNASNAEPPTEPGALPPPMRATRVQSDFWNQVSAALQDPSTELESSQVEKWLSSPAERSQRLREAAAVLSALRPEAIAETGEAAEGAAQPVPSEGEAPGAVAEVPSAPYIAPAPESPGPAELPGMAPFPVLQPPEAAEPAVAVRPEVAAKPAPVPQVPPAHRQLARIFAISDASVAAQKLRDYIHHRHDKADETFARLTAFVAASDAASVRRVLSLVHKTQPGPRTRKWVKETLGKLPK